MPKYRGNEPTVPLEKYRGIGVKKYRGTDHLSAQLCLVMHKLCRKKQWNSFSRGSFRIWFFCTAFVLFVCYQIETFTKIISSKEELSLILIF